MKIRLGRSLLWRNTLTLLAVQAVVWVVAVAVASDDSRAAFLVTMVVAAISVATILILATLARSIGRQTRRATDAARRFADGDFSGRLREDAADEFRELAVALNAMAGELDSSIDALQVQTSEMFSILQSMSNGLIALDREQRIIRLNAAALGMFELADVEIRGHAHEAPI